MRGIILDSLNPALSPALNLALEEGLLTALDACTSDHPGYFLLWRNAPSIIVGRHQNTAQEVNHELVRRYALPVLRRISGGGAVYHDAGNLNFSFIVPYTSATDFGVFMRPVAEVLSSLGLDAAFSGRNDILIQGRKVSGSAQARRGQALLHHGTLLVALNMDMLDAVLAGTPEKYASRGIASVRSRVANIGEFLPHLPTEHLMETLTGALMRRFATGRDTLGRDTLTQAQYATATRLAKTKYAAWEWNYGQAPPFTHTRRGIFAFGTVECRIDVRKGRIAAYTIYGDFFAERDIATLEARLCGLPHTPNSLYTALAELTDADLRAYFTGCEPAAVREFLCGTIPA